MRQYDLAHLYRNTVGFDRLVTMLDSLGQPDQSQTYPPYNIERMGENAYRITLAVAGFGEADLVLETRENTLSVKGQKEPKADQASEMLHQGIAARAFERRFQLADHVMVTGASLENGLLHIDLVREIPEAQKPRTIAIGKAAKPAQPKIVEGDKAA